MADFISAVSGAWSDPATWGGATTPSSNDTVLISTGHLVTYDVSSALGIGPVSIDGALSFSPSQSTKLVMAHDQLITIKAGGILAIGTQAVPIGSGFKAELYFASDDEVGGIIREEGGILSVFGDADFYGSSMVAHIQTTVAGGGGSFVVTGDFTSRWAPGQELAILRQYERPVAEDSPSGSWLITIDSLSVDGGGNTVIIAADPPISTNDVFAYAGQTVLNLSRNVIIGKLNADKDLGIMGRNLNGNLKTCASIIGYGDGSIYANADFCGLTRNQSEAGLVSTSCVHRNSAFAVQGSEAPTLTDCIVIGNHHGVFQCDSAVITGFVADNTAGIIDLELAQVDAEFNGNAVNIDMCSRVSVVGDLSGGGDYAMRSCSGCLVDGDIHDVYAGMERCESCVVEGDIYDAEVAVEACTDVVVNGNVYGTSVGVRGSDACTFNGSFSDCAVVAAESSDITFNGPVYGNVNVALSSCNFLRFVGIDFGMAPGDIVIPNGNITPSFAAVGSRRYRYEGCSFANNGGFNAEWVAKGRLESVRGENSSATASHIGGNASAYRVVLPNAYLYKSVSVLRPGGAYQSLMVTTMAGLSVPDPVPPVSFSLPVIQKLFTWSEEVTAIGHSRSVYVMLQSSWSGQIPTAAELWLEVEYLDAASGGTKSVVKSTQVVTELDAWTQLQVSFIPLQAGPAVYRMYVGNSGGRLYIDGGLYDDSGNLNAVSWSDGLPVINSNLFLTSIDPGIGDDVLIAFDQEDTGLTLADIVWDVCQDIITGEAIATTGCTLFGVGAGVYVLKNPNIVNKTFFRVHVLGSPEKFSEGNFQSDGNNTVEAKTLFTWVEYEAGHDISDGDLFTVSDVAVVVYSNVLAEGDPITGDTTDEVGKAYLYLDPGEYWLFRRKAGRTFADNPTKITVT